MKPVVQLPAHARIKAGFGDDAECLLQACMDRSFKRVKLFYLTVQVRHGHDTPAAGDPDKFRKYGWRVRQILE